MRAVLFFIAAVYCILIVYLNRMDGWMERNLTLIRALTLTLILTQALTLTTPPTLIEVGTSLVRPVWLRHV